MQLVIIKEYTRVYSGVYTVAKIIREKNNLPPEGVRFIRKTGDLRIGKWNIWLRVNVMFL